MWRLAPNQLVQTAIGANPQFAIHPFPKGGNIAVAQTVKIFGILASVAEGQRAAIENANPIAPRTDP